MRVDLECRERVARTNDSALFDTASDDSPRGEGANLEAGLVRLKLDERLTRRDVHTDGDMPTIDDDLDYPFAKGRNDDWLVHRRTKATSRRRVNARA